MARPCAGPRRRGSLPCAALAASRRRRAAARVAASRRPRRTPRDPRVVLAFLPTGGDDNPKPVLDRLDARPQLALGLVSATQGRYTPHADAARHLGRLAHVARPSTTRAGPAGPRARRGGDGSGFIFGWSKALERADDGARRDPARACSPSSIPGGAAYAGVRGRDNVEAVAAADRDGDVAAVSLGTAADARRARARGCSSHHRLVVVGLPTGRQGRRGRSTAAARPPRRRPAHRHADAAARVACRSCCRSAPRCPAAAAASDARTTTRLQGVVAGDRRPGDDPRRPRPDGARRRQGPADPRRGRRATRPTLKDDRGAPARRQRPPHADARRAAVHVAGARRSRSASSPTAAGSAPGCGSAALALLWVLPLLLVHRLARADAPGRDRDRRRRVVRARRADRPLRALAARPARPGARRDRRLRRRPRLRLDAHHPLAARRQPALGLALLRPGQRARVDARRAAARRPRRRSCGARTSSRPRAVRRGPRRSRRAAAIVVARRARRRGVRRRRASSAPTSAASSRVGGGIAVDGDPHAARARRRGG